MRVRALVVVGLLVTTAGCGSLVANEPASTETLTPAAVPTDTAEPIDSPETTGPVIAPGLTTGNVTDPEALAARHESILDDTSYVWRESVRTYRVSDDGEAPASVSERYVARNGSRFLSRTTYRNLPGPTTGPRVVEYATFGNDSGVYKRWSGDGGGAEYAYEPPGSAQEDDAREAAASIRRYLTLESSVVSKRTWRGSTEYYLVSGTRETMPVGNVSDYRARALVRDDGFVLWLQVSFTKETSDAPKRVKYSSLYTDDGTADVETPGWIDDVQNDTVQNDTVQNDTLDAAGDGLGDAGASPDELPVPTTGRDR